MGRCTDFVSKLKVHIVSKVATHKISLILNFVKNHIKLIWGLKIRSIINHEYKIDSELYLYVIVHQ
jgi:hypothetical protein